MDFYYIALLLGGHCMCLLAPFHFTWGAFWVGVALYYIAGVGVTISFHRNLSHRSFKVPKWLEYSFAYIAVLSLQGSPIEWVSAHRYHHLHADKSTDIHSPNKGFWFSHLNWVFDYKCRYGSYDGQFKNVADLENQFFYRFLHYTYFLHSVLLGGIFYAIGGLPWVVWGMAVRMIYTSHLTFSINSICHIWGKRVYDTDDDSKNNWVLALLTYGEGWHNNHHAFEYSARGGFEWYEIDATWYVIKFLQVVGLATDVKVPTESQKKRKALANKSRKEEMAKKSSKDEVVKKSIGEEISNLTNYKAISPIIK